MTGSAMKAATVSGPSRRITSSNPPPPPSPPPSPVPPPRRGALDAPVGVAPELALQAVVRGRFREVEEERLHALAAVDVATHRNRRECSAVIRLLPPDDLPAG